MRRTKPQPGARLNRSHPLVRGLVGCWLFNENGRRVVNLADGISSSVNSAQTWNTSDRGPALHFAGSPERIDAGNSPVFQDWTALTFEVWARRTSSASNNQFIISKGNDTCGMDEVLTGAWNVQFYIRTGAGTYPTVNGSTVVNPNEWHHRVGVWDGANIRLFIDAIQDGSDVSASGSLYLQNDFGIGIGYAVFDTARQHWLGDIGLVRVWRNRALSAVEIASLYADPYQTLESAPRRRLALSAPAATGQPMALRHTLDLTGARRIGRGII